MADLSSILGGMVQGFKDFGTGLVDMFGTGGAAIGDAIESIRTGRATNKNQDDFRKWLYQTDNTQDAAAKGLGTILNGVQTVSDFIPGAGAVTRNPLFNGVQGAIGGVADEFKMAGKDYDLGRAAQRAGVGAASGLASAYTNQALGKTSNKLINNGLVRGAAGGALAGGIANAGYTGIEGGSVQDMINAGLYGAQTGALVGGTTGLARELIKPTHKMDVALTDDERRARIANIDDQLAKLDTSTQEGIDRHNELMMARIKYEQPQEYMMPHRPTRSGIYADDLLAEGEDGLSYPKDVYDKPQNYTFMYTDTPAVMNETMAQLNAVRGNPNGEVTIYRATPGDTINDGDWITLSESYAKLHNDTQLDGKGNVLSQKVNVRDIQPAMDDLAEWGYFPQKKAPTNVADLMTESKPKTIYHGTNAVFEDFDESLPSVWFTDNADDIANTGLSNKGGKINIMERELPNNLKLADWDLADRLTKQQLIDRGYDGIAYTESGTSGKDTYYEIFKPNKTLKKIGKAPQKTVADLMLSPEQEEFFKGSKLRDENGKLMRVYHSSPNKFTTFDDSKLGSNTAYDNTAFGHFVTSDEDFSRRFRNIDGNTDEGYTMELYANAKKPITHPYEAAYKYNGDELDNIVKNYYKETNNPEALAAIKEWADESGQSLYDAYMDMSVDENPFEMAAADRKALQGKGYDAVEFVEGRKSGLVDGSNDDTPVSSYAIFSGNQLKDVNNLKPTTDADIMRSVALPGSNKKAKITNGVKRIGSDNVAPVDESTLPKGWKELRDILDEKYVDDITKKFGYKNGDFSKITPEQYEKYILDVQTSPGKKKGWQNQFEYKKSYMDADEYKKELKNIAIYEAKRKAVNDIQNMDLPQAQKNAIDTAINSMDYYATDDNRRYLSHYMPDEEGKEMFANNAASEADAEFSDRLGIGRSNTIKRNNIWSEDLNADGEYMPSEYALAVDPLLNKENAVSTLAHERLHSFQFEAPQGRYDKRVLDAYNELSKDLKPYLHDQATIDERYGKYYKDNLGGKYWASNIEQESRMMQQYLDNKGYTNRTVDGPRKNEYGEEINPAFDKFFDKLRALSKKGVALPAITALFGGGAIAGALTSGKDDKKKKSEVK